MKLIFSFSFLVFLSVSCKSLKTNSSRNAQLLLPNLEGKYEKVNVNPSDTTHSNGYLYIERLGHASFRDESWFFMVEHDENNTPIAYTDKIYKINRTEQGYSLNLYIPASISTKPIIGQKETFKAIKKDQLMKKSGCTVFLNERPGGDIMGSTLGRSCSNRFKGSLYARSEIKISADSLWLVNQGFDEYDRFVWGPKKYAPKYVKVESGK